MSESPDSQDRIESEAADWVARLSGGPLGRAAQADLDAWLQADMRHRAAYERALSVWRSMGLLEPHASALYGEDVHPDLAAGPESWRFTKRLAAMAAVLLVFAVAAAFWLGNPVVMLAADYSTSPGESREIVLADGSRVTLGPASALDVDYGVQIRRIELLEGSAIFRVAPVAGAEERPFVVTAAGGTARALGTEFMVDRRDGKVDVTVIESHVKVALGRSGPSHVLSPGQGVSYSDNGLGAVRAVDVERATAWQRGRLIFDRVPLSEVVAELNRYRQGRVVIANPALASRVVSGVFETDHPDRVLAVITRELDIRTASLPLVTLIY